MGGQKSDCSQQDKFSEWFSISPESPDFAGRESVTYASILMIFAGRIYQYDTHSRRLIEEDAPETRAKWRAADDEWFDLAAPPLLCTQRGNRVIPESFHQVRPDNSRRSCDDAPATTRVSLLITRISPPSPPFFLSLFFSVNAPHEDADLFSSVLPLLPTARKHHSQSAGGGAAISGLITSPLCRN